MGKNICCVEISIPHRAERGEGDHLFKATKNDGSDFQPKAFKRARGDIVDVAKGDAVLPTQFRTKRPRGLLVGSVPNLLYVFLCVKMLRVPSYTFFLRLIIARGGGWPTLGAAP